MRVNSGGVETREVETLNNIVYLGEIAEEKDAVAYHANTEFCRCVDMARRTLEFMEANPDYLEASAAWAKSSLRGSAE